MKIDDNDSVSIKKKIICSGHTTLNLPHLICNNTTFLDLMNHLGFTQVVRCAASSPYF